MSECKTCKDILWVCERHTDKPWFGITGDEPCCGGAGQLCECMKPIVTKEQVTANHRNNSELPRPADEYFWFETVTTGLSKADIQYGYQEKTKIGPNHYRTRWVKKADQPPERTEG